MMRCVIKAATFLCCLSLLAACRTGALPEAGLDVELFEKPGASLTYNPRGYWYGVAPAGAQLTTYAVIEHEGQTELFYVVPDGERAAQLLPLTPVESGWFASAVGLGAEPTFIDNLQEASISDTVGVWSGEPSDAVRWVGAAPDGAVSAVVLPAGAPGKPMGFYRWVRGVAAVDGGRVTASEGEFDAQKGEFLLLPEAPDSSDKLAVANISAAELEEVPDADIDVVSKEGPEITAEQVSSYITTPVGRQAEADVLVFAADGAVYVAHVSNDQVRLGEHARLVAAIAEVPVELRRMDRFAETLRGLEALRENRPLAAAYWLHPSAYAVEGNAAAAQLRLAELPAAGGLAQWSRVALLQGAEGLSADRTLYLARAHALEGDVEQAGAYGVRAAESFKRWSPPGNHIGVARAKLLVSHLEHTLGNSTLAAQLTRQAADKFKIAGDQLRRADAEMQLAGYLYAAGDLDGAIEQMRLARSRYFHGGSPYYSALAEIRLAELLLEAGQTEEAGELAGYAVTRLDKLDEPVGLTRAALVRELVARESGAKRGITAELQNGLARARELNDPAGQLIAASGLVRYASVDSQQRLVELGQLILETQNMVVEPLLEQYAQRSLATLCGQGLTDAALATGASAEQSDELKTACVAAVEQLGDDPQTMRSWLAQGYKSLQNGELELARSTAEELAASVAKIRDTQPVLAARVIFYRYAVLTDPSSETDGEETDKLIDEGLALLDSGVDPVKAGEVLFEIGAEQRARGQVDVASAVLEKAILAARQAKEYRLEREILFFLLDTYQAASRHDDLLRIARDGQKIASRAGPGADSLTARVLLYQSDAEFQLGRTADAGLHRSSAFADINKAEPLVRTTLLNLAAQLDLDRSALEAAEPAIVVALGIYTSMKPADRQAAENVAAFARLHNLHGKLGVRLGKLDEARKAYDTAIGLARNVAGPAGLALLADALAGRAALTDEEGPRAKTEEALVGVLDSAEALVEPGADVAALREGIIYFTDSGDASKAAELADAVHDAGFALGPREQAPCLTGRAQLFAGRTERGLEQLRVCAAHNESRPAGRLADLLVAFHDEGLAASQRAQQAADIRKALDAKLSEAETDRLELIETLPAAQKSYDDRRADVLRKTAAKTDKPADVAAFADYLLATGRVADAAKYVDEHSTVFFAEGAESPGTLIRLRLEAMVRQLQPVEAALYARRALSETGSISPEERAHISFWMAQNAVVAGQWWQAARLLRDARDTAESSTLIDEIDAFAKRFPPLSSNVR